jgi:polyhydroxyalkanoate synthase
VEWNKFLAARSSKTIAPPRMGAALCDAPGTYVLEG